MRQKLVPEDMKGRGFSRTDVGRAQYGSASIETLIADIRAGEMVILMDDEDRENEGDIVLGTHYTPEHINFMARYALDRFVTLTEARCANWVTPMVIDNTERHKTAFTVSIEAAEGVTTGISAADRSRTVQTAVAANAKPSDLAQPGHIFPVQRAQVAF